MSDPLAIPPDQIRTMGRAALDRIAAYYETLAARPILVPTTSAARPSSTSASRLCARSKATAKAPCASMH